MGSYLKNENQFENILSIKAKPFVLILIKISTELLQKLEQAKKPPDIFCSGGVRFIAKAMSAYDKAFSDAIYGVEKTTDMFLYDLNKCLSMMQLVEERIDRSTNPNYVFFPYANTVATLIFLKDTKVMAAGIRFQLAPDQKEFNEIILHVRFKQNEANCSKNPWYIRVNLIYGAYFKYEKPKN